MSISYNRLGSNGRLGNQMFQYAGLRGIAKQNGYSWLIPPPDDYGDSNYGLFDCFEMSTVTFQNFGFTENVQNLATGCFHFNEKFFRECPDNINLHDYFQTEKYFKNAESIIRQDYTFLPEILDPCKEVVEQFDKPIFIHVRRGDYVKQPENHPVCPLSYYENSLKEFPEDTPVFVFLMTLIGVKNTLLMIGLFYQLRILSILILQILMMAVLNHLFHIMIYA